MLRIALAGHVCLDLTPALEAIPRIHPGSLHEVGPLTVRLGGCVGNTARALAALGIRSTAHAVVGDDDLGTIARGLLERSGSDLALRASAERATSYSIVLEANGHDRTFWHHTGANAEFDADDLHGVHADLLHLGYPSLLPMLIDDGGAALEAALARAKARGATVSLDLAVVDREGAVGAVDWRALLRRVAPHVDVLSPSVDDLVSALGTPADADALAELLIEWGVAVVVISDGPGGMRMRTADASRLDAAGAALHPLRDAWADRRCTQDAVPVDRIVSTNGAGDAATAGLLCAIARRLEPGAALELAAAAAAAHIGGSAVSTLAHSSRSRLDAP